MIWVAMGCGLIGMTLSAFFSGCETGFYRVTRLRLNMDALGGDRVARWLAWLSDHPSVFVATTLAGNNVANYLTTLAVVLATDVVFTQYDQLAQMIVPLVASPVLFIYGELLPKYLFLQAPNRMLRAAGPAFVVFTVLFVPLSAIITLFSKLIESVVGVSSQRTRGALARHELQQTFEEGHEAGVLQPAQRQLAQGLIAVAFQPVRNFMRPWSRQPRARSDWSKEAILRLAQRHSLAALPLEDSAGQRAIGYVRMIDLRLNGLNESLKIRPLPSIPATETHLSALVRLRSGGEQMARVVDAQGNTLGIVTLDALLSPLEENSR